MEERICPVCNKDISKYIYRAMCLICQVDLCDKYPHDQIEQWQHSLTQYCDTCFDLRTRGELAERRQNMIYDHHQALAALDHEIKKESLKIRGIK